MAHYPSATRDGHMPQLDSLRTFAVFGVMVTHYLPNDSSLRTSAPWGEFGVWLFFVLSGFLITGVLLAGRRSVHAGDTTSPVAIRNFYIRRFLRLMPIYYLMLLAAAVALIHSRPHLWAFASYTQNFLFAAKPDVFATTMAHFWTLAVEEQFYFVWPLVVLFAPQKRLLVIFLATVMIGPLFRGAGLLAGFSAFQVGMMMPAHADTLGLGALLAYLRVESPQHSRLLASVGARLGLPLLILCVAGKHLGFPDTPIFVTQEAAAGLAFTWLVASASLGFSGIAGWILNLRALAYLGTISYGLYVFHFNVPGVLRDVVFPRLDATWPGDPWVRFLISAIVSIAIASVSWAILEQPVTRLKRHFPYSAAARHVTSVRSRSLDGPSP